MEVTLLPMGRDAVLVEVGGTGEVLALADALRAAEPGATPWSRSVTEVVPSARTLLVRVGDPADLPTVREGLLVVATDLDAPADVAAAAPHALEDDVVIPVTYDGADLAEVARLTGLGEDEVVRAHTGSTWRVGFIGFAPGFAYLVGGDERLHVPRRDTPRTAVPAGSVGLAGEFGGIYPRSSPGGWQLIGRTDAPLWDVDRDPPALLVPGATVRFEEA
ncbi:allophanate hydrolase subunit 1 [uncultured Serinicoccus sp.]|uniref:5-oxoprolinase subunit B family protein n=1 Tax=uncultured Serinicoccus sp. TaxID=735514 RepID=UPI002627FC57|nr:allophanate hydrolase subunit 1 [uncultured Serinicoccus sp.]